MRKTRHITVLLALSLLFIVGCSSETDELARMRNNSVSVSFDLCEYATLFPRRSKVRNVTAGGIESTMVETAGDAGQPYMRVEFLPIANQADFAQTLASQAQLAGLVNPEIVIERGSTLGDIGTYSGVKEALGYRMRVFGKMFVGEYSTFGLLIVEEESAFPSSAATLLLGSVQRRTPQSVDRVGQSKIVGRWERTQTMDSEKAVGAATGLTNVPSKITLRWRYGFEENARGRYEFSYSEAYQWDDQPQICSREDSIDFTYDLLDGVTDQYTLVTRGRGRSRTRYAGSRKNKEETVEVAETNVLSVVIAGPQMKLTRVLGLPPRMRRTVDTYDRIR